MQANPIKSSITPTVEEQIENQSIQQIDWKSVISEVSQILEAPASLELNKDSQDLSNLISYQRELNFYHLKVEFMAKAVDTLGAVTRRIQQ